MLTLASCLAPRHAIVSYVCAHLPLLSMTCSALQRVLVSLNSELPHGIRADRAFLHCPPAVEPVAPVSLRVPLTLLSPNSDLLGVKPTAGDDEIKKAYRKK